MTLETKARGATMKLGIAIDKHGMISCHFGKSEGFLVVTLDEGRITSKETRDNPHRALAGRGHGHGRGLGLDGCGEEHKRRRGHGHGHGRGHGIGIGHEPGHRCDSGGGGGHRWIDAAVGDCQAVITRGIGAGAVAALRSLGVRPVVLDSELTPDEAIQLFSEGRL